MDLKAIQQQSALQEAARLRVVIDTAIDGIITINSEGKILSSNQAACRLFKYNESELIGQNVRVLMDGSDLINHNSYISDYLKTGDAKFVGKGLEAKGQRKDGTVFPFRLAVSKMMEGDEVFFTAIVHDIGEEYRIREKLRKLNEKLEQMVAQRTHELKQSLDRLEAALHREKLLNITKSQFITIASHEFRTPLSAILSSADIIERYVTSEGQENRSRHIGQIRKSIKQLSFILDDLLNMEMLDQHVPDIQWERLDSLFFVGEIISWLKSQGYAVDRIQTEIAPSMQYFIADETLITGIMINVLSNALKYSTDTVYWTLEEMPDIYRITVSDTGIGISETDLHRIYDSFYRGSNTGDIIGTGIGLHLSKRYAEYLDGDIIIASELGQGTEVTISWTRRS